MHALLPPIPLTDTLGRCCTAACHLKSSILNAVIAYETFRNSSCPNGTAGTLLIKLNSLFQKTHLSINAVN